MGLTTNCVTIGITAGTNPASIDPSDSPGLHFPLHAYRPKLHSYRPKLHGYREIKGTATKLTILRRKLLP